MRTRLLVAGNIDFARPPVLILMVFGVEKFFDLIYVCIELKPLLVHRLRDAICCNAGTFEPSPHSLDGVLRGSKDVDYLLGRVMLTVVGRIVIRAIIDEKSTHGSQSQP